MNANASDAPAGIDDFAEVPVTIEARLEDRLMELGAVRKIDRGTVIPMRKAAGETLDVFIGNVRLASAEVVVIEDRLALRITEFDGLDL